MLKLVVTLTQEGWFVVKAEGAQVGEQGTTFCEAIELWAERHGQQAEMQMLEEEYMAGNAGVVLLLREAEKSARKQQQV